jgi:signal transduction histidine kinase
MTLQAISQATVDNVRTTPRPPLTKRLRPGHWTAIDYAVGVLLGLIVWASIRQSINSGPYPAHTVGLGSKELVTFAVAVVVVIAVARRRRHPVASLSLLLGCSVLVAVLSGGEEPSLVLFAPVAYPLYLIVATFDNRRSVGHVLVTTFAIMMVDAAILTPHNGYPIIHGGGLIPAIFAVVIAWSLGYIVRQRRRYSIGLQEEAASKAVTVERLRIARELHDVVAHSMSVIAVQAGYGQYVIDTQPEDARQALGAIQATSREALEEMRRMLGALRYADEARSAAPEPAQFPPGHDAEPLEHVTAPGPGGSSARAEPSATGLTALFRLPLSERGPATPQPQEASSAAPLFPAPGLADLDRLITRTAGAGVRAEVLRLGTPRDLPASIDLSAYRIIQEALTNVVKHAHASMCSVLLDYGNDELSIEVTDSGAGAPAMAMAGAPPTINVPGGGHGIIGMRERVSLLGGEFTAGPLRGYGFQVSARIPIPLPVNGAR